MDHAEALQLLDDLDPHRLELRLTAMHAMLEEIGEPQKDLTVVLVGGTNGKGSTAAFLESILLNAGYHVGTYTSPHLLRFEERIRLDGDPISPEVLAQDVTDLAPTFREHGATHFEAATLLALHRFREADVDIAILEAGLGGRLDATNVVDAPACTVITNVSLDHTEHLGDTVEEIAREKAHLVKPGHALVTGATGDGLAVLLEDAEGKGAPAWVLDRDVKVHVTASDANVTRFHLDGTAHDHGILRTRLAGAHQARNATLAIVAAEVLEHEGVLEVPPEAVPAGVEATLWPGRLQRVDGDPPLLLDAAHNPAAARELARYLEDQGLRPTVLFGALEGKDVQGMVEQLAPHTDEAVVTRPSGPRGLHPREGAREFAQSGSYGLVVEDLAHALETARAQELKEVEQGEKEPPGLILVTGSHKLVGDVLKHLEDQRADAKPWWKFWER